MKIKNFAIAAIVSISAMTLSSRNSTLAADTNLGTPNDHPPVQWAVCVSYVKPGTTAVNTKLDSIWPDSIKGRLRAQEILQYGVCFESINTEDNWECVNGPYVAVESTLSYCLPPQESF